MYLVLDESFCLFGLYDSANNKKFFPHTCSASKGNGCGKKEETILNKKFFMLGKMIVLPLFLRQSRTGSSAALPCSWATGASRRNRGSGAQARSLNLNFLFN